MTAVSRLLLVVAILSRSIASTHGANPLKKLLHGGGGMAKADDSGDDRMNTCDSALAKSLVQAHDEKAQIEIERDAARADHAKTLGDMDRLSVECTATKESLTHQVEQLTIDKQALEEASDLQRTECANELQHTLRVADERQKETQSKMEEQLEQAQQDWSKTMDDMDKAYAESYEALKAESEATLERVQNELNEKIESLKISLINMGKEKEQQLTALRLEMTAAREEMERELLEQYDKKNAELELVKKNSKEERQALLEEKEKVAKLLADDLSAQKQALEEHYSQIVTTLRDELEITKKNAIDQLTAKEDEAQTRMTKIQQEAEKYLEDTRGRHAKEVEQLSKSMKKLKNDHMQLSKKKDELERKYLAAAKENEGWHELYSKRSYCNFTHMTEDTTAAVASAGKIATEQLSAAATIASEKVHVASKAAVEQLTVATQVVAKAAEPHIESGRHLYDVHMKEHVDKHVMPIHEAHVKPALKVANKQIEIVSVEASHMAHNIYRRVIAEFKSTCPALKRQLREINAHPILRRYVREKCSDPKGTIDGFLLGLAIVHTFLFRRFLWRTFWFLVYLPFKIMWYVSPLPLFFPSRKTATPDVAEISALPDETTSDDVSPIIVGVIKKESVGPAQ